MPKVYYPKAIELRYKVHLRKMVQSWISRTFDILSKKLPPAIAEADQEHRVDGGEGSGNFGHSGRPGEVGGSGPGVYYRGADYSGSMHIKSEGVKRGGEWYGRPPSVYLCSSKEEAEVYANLMHPDAPYGVAEIHVPEGEKLIEDNVDKDFGAERSFRIEKDIPPEWVKSVVFYDPGGDEIYRRDGEIGDRILYYPIYVKKGEKIRLDAWPDSVDEIINQLRLSFDQDIRDNELYALNIGQRTSKWNNTQWRNTMKSVVGVEDVFRRDKFEASRLKSFVNMNTELITKLEAETLTSVRRIVETGIKSGDRYESIRDELLDEGFTNSEDRAELIARDQVGKLNGEFTEARQKSLGVEYYIWRTAGDDRVRDSHEALNGMLCKWDDDTVYSDDDGETWKSRDDIDAFIGTPGEDFQCRCYAEAVLDELLAGEEAA